MYTFNNCPYKVRYGVIPSRKIKNMLERPKDEIKNRAAFYNNLEKSIIEEGIRNPISVTIKNKEFICRMHGGSRLYTAQKLNLDIPCILADFDNHEEFETINNFDELYNKFKDEFRFMALRKFGVHIDSLKWRKDEPI